MLRVGLTGGLASGKSFVGATLVTLGCHLLKADELGHAALAPDGEAFPSVVKAFGEQILAADGAIDRRLLGALVFDDAEKLALLNSLVHPHVISREERWMKEIAGRELKAIAVVEAAILIETGSYRRFDCLVLAVCGREQQIERAMKRDHLTREEVENRLSRQMSLDEKRRFADFVVDTSGEKGHTVEEVRALYEALRRRTQ